MELFKASRQWAERPADERFWNVRELHVCVRGYQKQARQTTIPYRDLRAVPDGQEVLLAGKETSAKFTHWAFGQVCARAGAPAGYLRDLPATLASQCLNTGLEKRADENAVIMFHQNGGLVARSVTSDRYDRIWNADITPYLLDLLGEGWKTPPARPAQDDPRARPATQADLVGEAGEAGSLLSVKLGDMIAPAGCYASDHDMFVFMIDPQRRIEDGSDGGLYRGFFVWNSEVGASSFGLETFLFRHVCGNHIVWGAQQARTVKLRHVGSASHRFGQEIEATIAKYRDAAASDDEAAIEHARKYRLGDDKDAVLKRLFGMRLAVPQRTLETAFDAGNQPEVVDVDGDPRTAWGYANALTRQSQTTKYADERIALDRAAGKILDITF